MRYVLMLVPLLALLAAACGDDEEAEPSPSASPAADTIGSYDDRYDFRSFAAQIDLALRNGDVQFFLDNATFQDVTCNGGEFPALPESCRNLGAGDTVPAILVGVEASEGYLADAAQYEMLVRETMGTAVADASDRFGDGKPRLYAYAIRRDPGPSPAGVDRVDAIAAGIYPNARPDAEPQRRVTVFEAAFDGSEWSIASVLVAGPEYAVLLYLDPTGPETEPPGEEIFAFWVPWEEEPAFAAAKAIAQIQFQTPESAIAAYAEEWRPPLLGDCDSLAAGAGPGSCLPAQREVGESDATYRLCVVGTDACLVVTFNRGGDGSWTLWRVESGGPGPVQQIFP